jgi:hypothetical protein
MAASKNTIFFNAANRKTVSQVLSTFYRLYAGELGNGQTHATH